MSHEQLNKLIEKYQHSLKGGEKLSHAETLELQQDIKEFSKKHPGLNLGTSGKNHDGVDGVLGTLTKHAIALASDILEHEKRGKQPVPHKIGFHQAENKSAHDEGHHSVARVGSELKKHMHNYEPSHKNKIKGGIGDSWMKGVNDIVGNTSGNGVNSVGFGNVALKDPTEALKGCEQGEFWGVSLGLNNCGMNSKVFGKHFKEYLQKIVDAGCIPVVAIPHRGTGWFTEAQSNNMDRIIECEKEICKNFVDEKHGIKGIHFVEIQPLVASGKLSLPDHLHPIGSGYKKVIELMEREINKNELVAVVSKNKSGHEL